MAASAVLGDGFLTIRQAIVAVLIMIAIAIAFAAMSVEVFGGDE